ncbi:MAG: carboxylating nicotinate-nucleotide diphosphorylase [Bacteroidota bacterium]|jgi:nicotinate-nucleotide pyrophosphorylase (carboxylating)
MLNTQSAAFETSLNQFIASALSEDIGSGDQSAIACLDPNAIGAADCLIKAKGVIAGIEMAQRIFAHFDQRIRFTAHLVDGDSIQEGVIAFRVEGPQASLLSTERLVLNCLQRMSGIATLTQKVQQLIAHTNCRVLDTRKTTPNFRIAEKWAVKIGGGENHRMGLYDMIMLKDNHIDYAGGVAQAIEKTVSYLKQQSKSLPIVVETRTLEEVDACLAYTGSIARILLDNMNTDRLREALQLIDGRIPTEASGGINLNNVVSIAETGVDYVSMGSIIYSAKVLDMSLKAVNG